MPPLREISLDFVTAVSLKNKGHASTRRWKESDTMCIHLIPSVTDRFAITISHSAMH